MKTALGMLLLSAAMCGCMSITADGDVVLWRNPRAHLASAGPAQSQTTVPAGSYQVPLSPSQATPGNTPFTGPAQQPAVASSATPPPIPNPPPATPGQTPGVLPASMTSPRTPASAAGQPITRTVPSASAAVPPIVNTTSASPIQPVSHTQPEPTPGRVASIEPPPGRRSLVARDILVHPSKDLRAEGPTREPTPPAPAAARDARPPAAGPSVRLLNTRSIHLNYEVKDVGATGIAGVELWYTQDGQTWKKYEGPTQRQPPFVAELPEEGRYGLTLVPCTGTGVSKGPPPPGEAPQAWVEVDVSKPVVTSPTYEIANTGGNAIMTIRWTATDKNLSHRGITIACSEKPDGPWTPVAMGVENTGQYIWPMPPSVPRRFHVRVEAADQAGNVGMAQAKEPVSLGPDGPSVSILTVEPGD
jgi:hypothetical protein